MDLLEQVYRLCELIEARKGQRLADSLLRAAIPIPGLITRTGHQDRRSAGGAVSALHDTETLLVLAVRTRNLSLREADPTVRATRRLLERLRSGGSTAHGASSPSAHSGIPLLRLRRSLSAVRSGGPAAPKEYLLVHAASFLAEVVGIESLDPRSRDWLLSQLQEYVGDHPAHRVTVFFDEPTTYSRVTVGVEERAADGAEATIALILKTVRALPAAGRGHCTIVTSNAELAASALDDGAKTASAAWLLALFTGRPAAPPSANPEIASEPAG
jgi:hypothetical protein